LWQLVKKSSSPDLIIGSYAFNCHSPTQPQLNSTKGWQSKFQYFDNFLRISQFNIHPIFKILVSTPHNYGVLMGGKHRNFEDRMNRMIPNFQNIEICFATL
jgi:hypothetical protein